MTKYIDADFESPNRYDLAKFAVYEEDVFDLIPSFLFEEIMNLPISGYKTISGQEGDAALLSYEIYQDTQYWQILMEYNSLIEPAQLVSGLQIKYPSVTSLENLYFKLNSLQKQEERNG